MFAHIFYKTSYPTTFQATLFEFFFQKSYLRVLQQILLEDCLSLLSYVLLIFLVITGINN
jgi:hypothetical protein